MKRKLNRLTLSDYFNCVFLILIGFITLYPLIYIVSISFSSMQEAARMGFHLYPKEVSVGAYKVVFETPEIYRQYANTIIRTVCGTVLGLLVTSMFAYSVSQKSMPHRKLLMNMALFTMLFSGGIVPSYLTINKLGLIDNFLVLILPSVISAYNVIIMKSFFMGIPESISESAQIDGANKFLILFRIILPISKPVLATVGLWMAVSHWNSWYDAMIYINSEEKQVIQNFLRKIIMENNTNLVDKGIVNELSDYTPETIKAATVVVTVLPILCVYPFIQKYFVKGVTIGAVKG